MSNPFENQIKSIREQLIRIQGKKIGAFAKGSGFEQSQLMHTEAGLMAQLAAAEAKLEINQERQKAEQERERKKVQQETQQKALQERQRVQRETQQKAQQERQEAQEEARRVQQEARQKTAQTRVASKSR